MMVFSNLWLTMCFAMAFGDQGRKFNLRGVCSEVELCAPYLEVCHSGSGTLFAAV